MALGNSLAHGQSAPLSVITPLHGAAKVALGNLVTKAILSRPLAELTVKRKIRLKGESHGHLPTRHVSDKAGGSPHLAPLHCYIHFIVINKCILA